MGEKMTPCAECGMPCEPGEYHPYAACLMFKGCHNSTTVRTHLTQPAQAVDVPPEDLQIEVFPPDPGGMRIYRPRGVKVTHKPTGITVACDHERSQHANRDTALRALTAALPGKDG